MNTSILNQRRAGLLVPAYALRRARDFGIGDTQAVKEALDFCAATGFEVLQILPIHETYGDHSPYSPISSRALSPSLLTLTPEDVPGLTQEILDEAASEAWLAELRTGNVSHEVVYPLKVQILLRAHLEFAGNPAFTELHQEFDSFRHDHADWLEPYCLFRLLIREYEGSTIWSEWRPEHRSPETAASWLMRHPARIMLETLRDGFAFIQWIAWRQWKSVRAYADHVGVRLMGEVSFGVSMYSADVWGHRSLFDPEWFLGTRPLSHFDTNKDSERWGQNWGFLAFRWENHRSTSFQWLRGRVTWAKEFFHAIRLDHLRGYFRAYMFPWPGGAKHVEFSNISAEEASLLTGGRLPRFVPGDDENPTSIQMNELQGRELFGQMIDAAGDMDMVGEIMGDLPEYMSRTLDDLKLASLVFPQLQRTANRSIHAADTFRELSLVSYANHDNAPLAMLYVSLRQHALEDPAGAVGDDFRGLLGFAGIPFEQAPERLDAVVLKGLQAALFATRCRLAVLMCSDLLGIPLRFNLPGSFGKGTWSDRLEMTLTEYARHPDFGARIEGVSGLIRESGRSSG